MKTKYLPILLMLFMTSCYVKKQKLEKVGDNVLDLALSIANRDSAKETELFKKGRVTLCDGLEARFYKVGLGKVKLDNCPTCDKGDSSLRIVSIVSGNDTCADLPLNFFYGITYYPAIQFWYQKNPKQLLVLRYSMRVWVYNKGIASDKYHLVFVDDSYPYTEGYDGYCFGEKARHLSSYFFQHQILHFNRKELRMLRSAEKCLENCVEKPAPKKPEVKKEIADQKKLKVNGDFVMLAIWDYQSVDGDVVDVFVNDSMLRENLMLSATPFNIKVPLTENDAEVFFLAKSQGTSGPCTVRVKVLETSEEFTMNATKGKSMKISLEKK